MVVAAVKSHLGLVVLDCTDDPNTETFWLLDMTAPQFERWWQEREEFWWPVTEEDQMFSRKMADNPGLAKVFGTEIPALRPAMVLPGTFLRCWPAGADQETTESFNLWMLLYESKRHHYCRLCCDEDSFLTPPDGRRIFHKGYQGKQR